MFNLKTLTLIHKPLIAAIAGSFALSCSGPNTATVNKYDPYRSVSPVNGQNNGNNSRNATPVGNSDQLAPVGNNDPVAGGVNDPAVSGAAAIYESTVYPILKEKCGACHNSAALAVQSPEFADENPITAWERATSVDTGVKINFLNLEESRFYQRSFEEGHNCGDTDACAALAAQILPALQSLKDGLEAQSIPFPGVDVGNAAQQTDKLTFAQSVETPRDDFDWETLVIEAETATFTGMMKAIEDGDAKGGSFIGVEDGTSGDDNFNRNANVNCATYNINIPLAGMYRVLGLMKAENNNSNSFQLIVDNGDINRWQVENEDGVLWRLGADDDTVQNFNLTAGNHEFKICQGKDGTLLDQLAITRMMVNQNDLADYDPGIATDLGPVQVLSYDVAAIAKVPGATLSVEIAEFNGGDSYKIKNLKIVKPAGSAEISVKNISVLCNGFVLTNVASYSRVDLTTTGESTLLSSTAEILQKDPMTNECELSFEFESLGLAAAAPAGATPP